MKNLTNLTIDELIAIKIGMRKYLEVIAETYMKPNNATTFEIGSNIDATISVYNRAANLLYNVNEFTRVDEIPEWFEFQRED